MDSQVQSVVDELFPLYDKDHSGFLETKELSGFLTQALKRLGVNATVTDSQAEQAIKVIDKNSDRQVNKFEVADALKSILEYKRQGSSGNNTSVPSPSPQPQPQPHPPPPPPQQHFQPTQPHNSYSPNNGWGNPPPQAPSYNNSWGPSPSQNNAWQSNQPANNNWNAPPTYNNNNNWGPSTNNSWGQTQNNNWGQPPNNYSGPNNYGGQGGHFVQPNNWNNQSNDWGNTQFYNAQDQNLKRMIDQLYTRYDSDRSGSFDKREMVKAMNELLIEYGVHMRINQHQAGRLIREIDSSGDGRVQKSEFFRMVKTILSGTDDY